MQKRPTSITVIAWILIVSALITLGSSYFAFKDPMVQEMLARNVIPVPVQYALAFIGLCIQLVSSVAMLKAQNWGRLLYIGWGAIGLLLGLATSPAKLSMILGAIFYAVVVFFLLRPIAQAYFKSQSITHDDGTGSQVHDA